MTAVRRDYMAGKAGRVLKPKTRTDRRGNTIEAGARVAYNYSGDVASGTVVKVTNSEIHIERDSEFHGTNPISRVKRPEGVLVIHEGGAVKDQIARIKADQISLREAYVAQETHKLEEREDRIKLKLTALIEIIGDAWDLDEVKMRVEEMFGPDTFEDNYRNENIEKVISGG